MQTAAALTALAGVWAVVVISPGPDFVATVHHATAHSRRAGLSVVAGIAAGTAVWAVSALAGLGLLLAHASWLLEAVRLGGTGVLAWLGVRTITHARRPAATGLVTGVRAAPWRTGLLTDLANPKAAVFWSSLFAALLPSHPPMWVQGASVLVVVVIAATWYGLVALCVSLSPVARAYQRSRRRIDYLTGGVFFALSARLLAAR